ncbi:MAG: hypothetical protein WAL25_12110 [Acidimicrobiia bacterium]
MNSAHFLDKIKDYEFRGPALGGVVTGSFLFAVVIGVGRIGSFEGLRLIEAVIPTARFLGSTVVGAAVTVLALLLTLIGLSMSGEHSISFSDRLYTRCSKITRIAVACMIMGVGVLLAVSLPIGEVDRVRGYYDVLYYVLTAAIAVLGGLLTTLGLMIGATLRGLLGAVHPEGESDLVDKEASESRS